MLLAIARSAPLRRLLELCLKMYTPTKVAVRSFAVRLYTLRVNACNSTSASNAGGWSPRS